jgi:hypothetical protein
VIQSLAEPLGLGVIACPVAGSWLSSDYVLLPWPGGKILMELEHRVEKIEREVGVLKRDLQGTLLEIQRSMSRRPADPSRWRKRAWVLALLNMLLAITLFTNVRFYTPDPSSSGASPLLSPWLRALWETLAFLWLILQMYPLALLLGQEEEQLQDVAWRNAAALFTSNPGLALALGMVVLLLSIVSVLFPSLWLVGMVVLFGFICGGAVRYLFRALRQRGETRERK